MGPEKKVGISTTISRKNFLKVGIGAVVLYVAARVAAHQAWVDTCNGIKSRGQIAFELQGAGVPLRGNDQNLANYQSLACAKDAPKVDRRSILAKALGF